MYRILLTDYIARKINTQDSRGELENRGEVMAENHVELMADDHEILETGWIRFTLNNKEVASFRKERVIGFIRE